MRRILGRLSHFITATTFVVAMAISLPSYASSADEIEARLNSTFEILLRELPKLETKDQAKDLIRRHIIPITDARTSGRLMLGKWWRKATDSQKDRFVKAMMNKLINTYAAFLLDDSAQRAQFNVVRITASPNSKGTATKYSVVTTITVDQTTDVIFTIAEKTGKDWGLVDVKAEGISMTLTWRQTFNNLIRQPADIEKVITQLETGKVKKQK